MEKDKIEVLQTASTYLLNLSKGVKTASQKFQDGQITDASSLSMEIIDGLGWIISVMVLLPELQDDNLNVQNINSKLSEMLNAFENQDYILVGDIMEYEIMPVLEVLKTRIDETLYA